MELWNFFYKLKIKIVCFKQIKFIYSNKFLFLFLFIEKWF